MSLRFANEGGVPITAEIATELRQLVFGTAAIPMRAEWTQTPFTFNTAKEELSYGLRSPRNATRGLLSVVQGFILKYLLFTRRSGRGTTDPLQISVETQKDALLNALIEILRLISDKGKVTMVLPALEEEPFVSHSVKYFHDSITEKLYLFTLSPHDELENFMKRHFNQFAEDEAPGTLLFLYSAVLTRSMGKVRSDLGSNKVIPLTMTNNEEGSLMIVTLLLTGRATPYLHNGVVNVGDENSYATPQYGILNRCAIGLLLWDNENLQPTIAASRQPGSRLKTPNYPIWVTSCAGHYGVTYNKNPDLLRNYHAESRFDLVYYSCSGHQIAMTIDNRSYNEQATGMLERTPSTMESSPQKVGKGSKSEKQGNSGVGVGIGGGIGASGGVDFSGVGGGGSSNADIVAKQESTLSTPLQRLIHTKWEEAHISFHVQPSMLSYLFSTQQ